MGMQDILMEKLVKQIDFQKLIHEALAKTNIDEIIKALLDSFKHEIDKLQGDVDHDGRKDLDQALSILAAMQSNAHELVELLKKVHAQK